MPADRAVAIARTDDTSRVFRADRQTVVAVTDRVGGRQTRFVGLLATNAYRVSVLDIPGVGPAVADALDLTPARMHTHTGRATRTVLENLPRDLVFELEPSALARLVAAIVGLQERQLVRVFEVPEPVGPWITVLVYLPRTRFTAELPERVADAVAAAYSAEQRMFESHVGASSLARIAVSVRCPDGQRSIDLEMLERTVDELSTSWPDRLKAALVADFGEDRGRALFEHVGEHAPPSYRAAVPPERAISDVRRIASLLDGDRELVTSLGHDVDAAARRVALPRLPPRSAGCAVGAAAAARPPRAAGARRAAVHVPPRRPSGCSSTTSAYASSRASSSTSTAERPCRTPSLPWSPARSRATGTTGSSCGPGSARREVAMVRAYGKYLRQIGFAFSQPYIEDVLGSHPRLVADLVELFHARFDPSRFAGATGDGSRRARRRRCGRVSTRRSTPSRRSTTTASAAPS